MAIPKFYLRKRKDQEGNFILKEIPIELNYSFNGKRLQYYTGLKIDSKHFIVDYFKTAGKSPVKKAAPNSEYINDSLEIIKSHVEEYHLSCKHSGYAPTVEDFRQMLDEKLKGKGIAKEEATRVHVLIDSYLHYIQINKAYGTFKNTNTAMNHIKAFLSENKKSQMSVNDIDQVIVDSFRAFLIKKEQVNNTVVKNIARFRAFNKWLMDRGYTLPLIRYELKENDIEVIALSEAEIEMVVKAELLDPALIEVRDIFLFGCYTGMRYGDIKDLKKTDVYENDIRFPIQKGGSTINHSVPLVKLTRSVLDKYKDSPTELALPCLSNQRMNKRLKQLMKFVGINERLSIAKKGGDGKVTRENKEKWELVTCHTSRKTYVTLMISKGMSEILIKEITGHSKNSKSFSKYYTVSEELKQKEMNRLLGS